MAGLKVYRFLESQMPVIMGYSFRLFRFSGSVLDSTEAGHRAPGRPRGRRRAPHPPGQPQGSHAGKPPGHAGSSETGFLLSARLPSQVPVSVVLLLMIFGGIGMGLLVLFAGSRASG